MANPSLVGRVLAGFELVEELGRGAFATVYRARQLRLGRDVAVKVLDPLLARDADAARRFDREGRSAASLDHPAIVPVYEAGEDDGYYFIAMRLVAGRSLAEELRAGPLDPARAASVVEEVAAALDHAHERGVLHRDVKPSNILVEDDRVWLADFGIAATVQDAGVYTLGAIGTFEYMAPEQAQPGQAGPAADLYALGCVAYECVTGRPPFAGRDLPGLLYAHAHEPVPPVGEPALDGFFATAMAKQPDSRHPSGAALADAFASALGAGPGAPVVGAGERPRRGGRVRRSAAVGVALVLVAGSVAGVVVANGDGGGKEGEPREQPEKREEPVVVRPGAGIEGPVAVEDTDGVEYDLPAGWSIRSFTEEVGGRRTEIYEGDKPAVVLTSSVAQPDDTPATVAARTEQFECPATNQHPATLSGGEAVRCQFKPTGEVATPANQVVVLYTVRGGKAWVLRYPSSIQGDRLTAFLFSLELPSARE